MPTLTLISDQLAALVDRACLIACFSSAWLPIDLNAYGAQLCVTCCGMFCDLHICLMFLRFQLSVLTFSMHEHSFSSNSVKQRPLIWGAVAHLQAANPAAAPTPADPFGSCVPALPAYLADLRCAYFCISSAAALL